MDMVKILIETLSTSVQLYNSRTQMYFYTYTYKELSKLRIGCSLI